MKLTKHYQVNNKDCMEDTINNMVNQSREPIYILERQAQIDTLREKKRELVYSYCQKQIHSETCNLPAFDGCHKDSLIRSKHPAVKKISRLVKM